jgi:predicted DNA-binding WGR domain protein
LDALARISDSYRMISQPYHLYVERKDASKNMARYYAMSIEPNLFGDVCLLRKWGRIGAKGQMKVHHFGREEEAVHLFLALLRQKRRRGYRPRTACDVVRETRACTADPIEGEGSRRRIWRRQSAILPEPNG